ncbi:MAG: hypothetical protein AAFV96_15880, partial [Pseudomonadota bacterium]
GRVMAVAAIWGTAVAVFLLALWLYATTPSQGTPSVLRRLLRGVGRLGPQARPAGRATHGEP